jgi:hypothetical protein
MFNISLQEDDKRSVFIGRDVITSKERRGATSLVGGKTE